MKEKCARYERCEQCGRIWNVSVTARLFAGVYVCPACEKDNRRAKRQESKSCMNVYRRS